jgi:hypothetical protein
MNYLKVILSGLAAIFLAYLVALWPVFKHINGHAAIGLDVFSLGFSSPLLWILASLFFAFFFAASRIRNKPLKTFLFWIPALLFSTILVTFLALFTCALVRFRHP